MEFILTLVTTAILCGTLFSDANAADFQRTTLSYLAGDGYVTGEHQRNIINFDHIKSVSERLLYTDVDLQNFNGQKARIISHAVEYLGTGLYFGGHPQNAQLYSNANVGMGFDWFTHNGFVGTDVYYRTCSMIDNGVHIFGFTNINLCNSFTFDGFVDVSAPNKGQTRLVAQPSIMYNINKSLSVSVEQQLYLNKVYVNGPDESGPQIKLSYEGKL